MIEQSVSLASNGVVKVPGYEQLVRFGYTKNRGVYRLAVTASGEWAGLAIRCFWHVPDGKDPASSLVADGYVDVPASVTAQPGNGCITFEGSDGTKTVTSADLRYRVSSNSGTEDGTMPEPGTPAWQQLVDAVHTDATAAEQAKTDAQTAAQQAADNLQELKNGIANGDFKGEKGDPGPAVALDTTLTHEGEAADAKVTGDKISGLKEDVGDLSSNINAIRFMSESTKTFCTCCASFGKYLYIFYNNGSGSFCDKYDVSIDYSPTLANTLKLTDERLACSDAKIENGYLYVTLRDGQGGTNTTEGKTLGELHIISLNSFHNVKTLTMDWKCTALTIHKDYLVIGMQLAGYDLYDLTNPTEPTLTYSFRPEIGSVEYQECAFFERDNKTYFIDAGFGFGFYIWDVTSKTLPIRVGTFMFSQAWNNGDNLHLHTESIVIDGNIAYATLSVSEKYIDTEYDKRGIIKFDISNLDVYKYERMNEIPYEQILINKTDYSPFYGDYDVKPTRLVKVGNALVTNSGAKGLACFKIEDNSVKYNGLIPVSDTSIIDRIYATSDGRIFGVNVYNTKLSGKDMIMIRLVNVKF